MINAGNLAFELIRILKGNAPVRDKLKYPGRYGSSPYPGNLRDNGIYVSMTSEQSSTVLVGGNPADYAVETETTSRKKGWHKKSETDFLQYLQSQYKAKIMR